jgi:lipopolysaccharide transport system permease protein
MTDAETEVMTRRKRTPRASRAVKASATAPSQPISVSGDMEVRVTSSTSQVRRPLALFRAMFRDLIQGQELAWRLFVRDVTSEYRDSVLGYLWILLPPVGATLVWVLLRNSGIIAPQELKVPYILYVLSGSLLWESFVGSLSRAQDSVIRNQTMLAKARPNYEGLLLASFWYVCLNCLIRVAIVYIATFAFTGSIPWQAFAFAPWAILTLLLYGFMVGMLLAPFSAMFRDVQRVMGMIFGFWFMATPIVYSIDPDSPLIAINPIAPLLLTCRDLLTTGDFDMPILFTIYATLTFLFFVLTWAFYRISIPHIMARTGG